MQKSSIQLKKELDKNENANFINSNDSRYQAKILTHDQFSITDQKTNQTKYFQISPEVINKYKDIRTDLVKNPEKFSQWMSKDSSRNKRREREREK